MNDKNNNDLNCRQEKRLKGKDNDINSECDIEIEGLDSENESNIFDLISTILEDDEIPVKSNFTVSQSIEEFEPLQEKSDELILTEKVQVNWSPELHDICHKAKDLYNFALFICRKVFFLYKKNPNVSWDDFLTIRENIMPATSVKNYAQKRQKLLEAFDKLRDIIKWRNFEKIGNALSTLIKYSKFYKNMGYTLISQQINRALGTAWQIYKTNLNLFYKGELKHGQPNLPFFKSKNGEFIVIYNNQNINSKEFREHMERTKQTIQYKTYSKTTAELLFPKRHRSLPTIRVRYEILRNVRDVRIIPKRGYYEIEIRYSKKITNYEFSRGNAIAIDLGVRNPLAIVNNIGMRPILLQGKELKEANYLKNKDGPNLQSVQSVYKDILKRINKNKTKTIFQIIRKRRQKYLKDFQWKIDLAEIIIRNPEITYDQFCTLYDNGIKLRYLFNYLTKLRDMVKKKKVKSTITNYLIYEKQELARKQRICDNLENILSREIDPINKFLHLRYENQNKLNKLNRVYRNKNRDGIHKLSRFVVNLCKQHDIGTTIIGYNEFWKNHSNLSKAVNRRFVPLPFYKLIKSIKYKAMLCGINVIIQEESYTSKCSALDNESIEHHRYYKGMRAPFINGKRHYGQFYSKVYKKYIHSDVNGAFNISRKAMPHLFEILSHRQILIPPQRIAVT